MNTTAEGTEILITATGLVRNWPGVRAVDGVSLEVPKGETLCIIGPNGAGKTTLLGLLGGVILPSAGHVKVFGLDRWKKNFEIRKKSTYLPVEPVWGGNETPYEFLRMYAQVYGIEKADFYKRIERLATQMDMVPHLGKPIASLSTGMKKKTGLMAAFMPDIPLRFLDEPFSGGIDPLAVERLYSWLAAAKERGETTIFTTQMLEQAETVADRVLMLHDGAVRYCAKPDELIRIAGIPSDEPRALAKAFIALAGHRE